MTAAAVSPSSPRAHHSDHKREMANLRKNIMVAVNQSSIDGYPHPSIISSRALSWTIRNIIRFNPGLFQIVLIHVLPRTTDACCLPIKAFVDKMTKGEGDTEAPSETDAKELLSSFVDRWQEARVDYETMIKFGDPARVICSEVENEPPQLLVLGRHGVGAVRSDSVCEYCVNNARCPVVVIKHMPDKAPEHSGVADD